jgi:2-phospho-L-lactate/phosphoenolpyruvate guanylyltransferase
MTPDPGTVADVATWTVVVPVKLLATAKSRLGLPDDPRVQLAFAMALDTIEVALACPLVDGVIVVTDDDDVRDAASEAGAVVVADEPNSGLNAALRHGAAIAAQRWPDRGVAAISADLPAMQPDQLATALRAGASHRSVLADASGRGTSLLTAPPATPLTPAYGEGSFAEHVRSGARPLEIDAPGLRLDVDTRADLTAALALGCGPRTTTVVTSLGLDLRVETSRERVSATVETFDSDLGSGRVVLDDGTPLAFTAAAMRSGGLRLLRPGQRVRVDLAVDDDGPTPTRLTIG